MSEIIGEAVRNLHLSILPGVVLATCKQCGEPAVARFGTDAAAGYLCRAHVRLAVNHYLTAHRLG